jgi:hypothetical protein
VSRRHSFTISLFQSGRGLVAFEKLDSNMKL